MSWAKPNSFHPSRFQEAHSHQKPASMGPGECTSGVENACGIFNSCLCARAGAPSSAGLSVLRYASRSLSSKCAARAQRSVGFVRRSVERRNLKPEMRRQNPAQRRQLSSSVRTTKTIKSSGHPQPSRARGSHCRAGRPKAHLPLRQSESNRDRRRP